MADPKMNKKPLSVEEVVVARDRFFDIFNAVKERMPEAATQDETLKIMEHVCHLAHKLRDENAEDEKFGFLKDVSS